MTEIKITEEHISALHEAVYPMKFHKNRSGLRKTILVREVLDYLKTNIPISDSEIAANLQDLTKCPMVEEWINKEGTIFRWTDKGFVATGGYRWVSSDRPDTYCICPYPVQSGVTVQGRGICGKCNKQLA